MSVHGQHPGEAQADASAARGRSAGAADPVADPSSESLRGHSWFGPILDFFDLDVDGVDPRVHGADEMFEQALLENGGDVDAAVAAYLGAGAQIARTVERFCRAQWSELDPSWSMLDFGSGYGRVTRFLPAVLGRMGLRSDRIWASDLLPGAVRFQREVLGVGSFPSHREPARVGWPQVAFDLIYVGSLFTHLPRRTFDAWLQALCARLSEGGVLLFSVHDLRLKPSGVAVDADGFAFVESSESREIDHATYGSTWLGASALRGALGELARCTAHRLHWRRYPRALCGFQDLVAVSRREIACRRLGSVGQVDDADLRGDKYRGRFDLRLEGWSLATGCEGGSIGEDGTETPDETSSGVVGDARSDDPPSGRPTVEVRFRSERDSHEAVVVATPDAERSDLAAVRDDLHAASTLAGWRVDLELPGRVSRGRDLLLVSTRAGERDVGTLLFAGSMDRLLLDRAQEHFRRRRDRVFELAETIEQVKQSRFWRARAAWFRVKRRFGWTDESPTGPDLQPGDRRP